MWNNMAYYCILMFSVAWSLQHSMIVFHSQHSHSCVLRLRETEKVCLQTYSRFLSLCRYSSRFHSVNSFTEMSWASSNHLLEIEIFCQKIEVCRNGVGAFPWQHLLPLSHKPFSFLVEKQNGKAKSFAKFGSFEYVRKNHTWWTEIRVQIIMCADLTIMLHRLKCVWQAHILYRVKAPRRKGHTEIQTTQNDWQSAIGGSHSRQL